MKKRKIAFWHRYGPSGHTSTCHSIPHIIRKLHERGVEVHYFGLRENSAAPEMIKAHCTIHALPFRLNRGSAASKLFGTLFWYAALPALALRCRLMKMDAVFWDETLPWGALIARVFYGRNICITVADFFLTIYSEQHSELKRFFDWLQQVDYRTWRTLPLIFTKVNYTRTFLAERGVDPDRVCCAYNPCDTELYSPRDRNAARSKFGLAANDFVVVHHGVLHPNKGNDRIIRAMADLKNKLPNLKYLLVGSGPEMNRLKLMCSELGMTDRVIFTGWLPTEQDVVEAIRTADVGLVMRIGQFSDNFHVTDTLSHEMACGLPILAARLKGVEELVKENKTGLLFDPNDMFTLKAQLTTLHHQKDLRIKMGMQARAKSVEAFDIETISSRMAEALFHLTN
ncbi:MAG: glycosyltransferase family 4 protein [Kiritimatiellaceae bacterium]|nr:glycosyltransferase family 4 protein [Kiritimatiellaceae bacterium]